MGQRSSALHQYHLCRDLLDHELGIALTPETEALAQAVRAGEIESAEGKRTEETHQESVAAETQYVRSGDIHLAYQVVGRGRNLVFVPGFMGHLDSQWEEPNQAAFFKRLSSLRRLIRYDKRGTGLSDRDALSTSLEERVNDLRTVLDAVVAPKTAMIGLSEGGALSLAFAAAYPERVDALVLWNSFATISKSEDHPWAMTWEQLEQQRALALETWGKGEIVNLFAADSAADVGFSAWWSRFERLSMSPGTAAQNLQWIYKIDVRSLLPMIQVPTLVICSREDILVPPDSSHYLAKRIPGAQLVERPGRDHFSWRDPEVANIIEEFLTGAESGRKSEPVLALKH